MDLLFRLLKLIKNKRPANQTPHKAKSMQTLIILENSLFLLDNIEFRRPKKA